MKHRMIIYFTLLGFTFLLCILSMLLFVYLFSSREKGMAWGICCGLFSGNLLPLFFFKFKQIYVFIHSIIYSLSLLPLLYISSNYLALKFMNPSLPLLILFTVSILVAWEIANFSTKKLVRSLAFAKSKLKS